MEKEKTNKKPVNASSLLTATTEKDAKSGLSGLSKDEKPSLLISLIKLISVCTKLLDKFWELVSGNGEIVTKINLDGSYVTSFLYHKESGSKIMSLPKYDIDWQTYERADVLKSMIDDQLLEEFFPDEHTRGLRLSSNFKTQLYNKYMSGFISDIEFINLPFIFSRKGEKLPENTWRQFKKRH